MLRFLDADANRVLALAARSAAGEGITSLHILAALCHVLPELRLRVVSAAGGSDAAAQVKQLIARCEEARDAEMVFRPDGKRALEAALSEEDPPVTPRGLLLGLLNSRLEAHAALQALGLRRGEVAP